MISRGIRRGFGNDGQVHAISTYAGSMPTPGSIVSNWTQYNTSSSNLLVHHVGASWTHPSSGILLQLSIPPAVNALNSGVAAWCILWSTNISAAQIAGSTLPSTSFMVVSASDLSGAGIIRFTDTNIGAGASIVIGDGSFGATSS